MAVSPLTEIVASRYRVLRELGRGGMGAVYLVEHTRTGDHLALKVMLGAAATDPAALERFKREARASARIKSDHVVKVVDADVAPELDGAPFLVMELLDGCDLEKLVEQRGKIPPAEVVKLLAQAARGLDKAHAVGIVHRDLKPENLFLHHREDGSTIVKVVDFGISKSLRSDGLDGMAAASMTQTGAVMGTPLYMAPEQARGRAGEISPATDVWAMGLIALYLMVGEIYWRAETIGELIVQIVWEPLYPPSQRWSWLPLGFDAWFARSCARDPSQRFGGIGEQIEALAELAESGTALMPAAAAAPPPEPRLPAVLRSNTTTSPTSSAAAAAARLPTRPVPSRGGRLPILVGAAMLAFVGAVAVGVRATRTTLAKEGIDASDAAPIVPATQAPTAQPGSALPMASSAPEIVADAPLDAGPSPAMNLTDAAVSPPSATSTAGHVARRDTSRASAGAGPASATATATSAPSVSTARSSAPSAPTRFNPTSL